MTGLEALETFGNLWMGYSTVKETYPEHYATIEKSLKALEIIKEKVMPLVSISDGRVWDCELYQSIEISEEESILLKEVLSNERN